MISRCLPEPLSPPSWAENRNLGALWGDPLLPFSAQNWTSAFVSERFFDEGYIYAAFVFSCFLGRSKGAFCIGFKKGSSTFAFAKNTLFEPHFLALLSRNGLPKGDPGGPCLFNFGLWRPSGAHK